MFLQNKKGPEGPFLYPAKYILILCNEFSSLRYYVEDKADMLITGIICSLSVFCVLYFFFQINLIGAGDIKLLMLMPLFLDMSTLLPILFFSFGNALLLYVMKENIFSQHTSQKRGIRMSIPIFLGYGLWYLNQIF